MRGTTLPVSGRAGCSDRSQGEAPYSDRSRRAPRRPTGPQKPRFNSKKKGLSRFPSDTEPPHAWLAEENAVLLKQISFSLLNCPHPSQTPQETPPRAEPPPVPEFRTSRQSPTIGASLRTFFPTPAGPKAADTVRPLTQKKAVPATPDPPLPPAAALGHPWLSGAGAAPRPPAGIARPGERSGRLAAGESPPPPSRPGHGR